MLLSTLSLSHADVDSVNNLVIEDYIDDVFEYSIPKEDDNVFSYTRVENEPDINLIGGHGINDDDTITVSLTVLGSIKNQGEINYSLLNGTLYFFLINTSDGIHERQYNISYVNYSYKIDKGELIDFVVEEDTLTATIQTINGNEQITSLLLIVLDIQRNEEYTIQKMDMAHSDYHEFTVSIVKPGSFIYLNNNQIIPFFVPLVIGSIDVEIQKTDWYSFFPHLQQYVEIYEDDTLVATPDIDGHLWYESSSMGTHTLKITLFDPFGNRFSDEKKIITLF